MIYADNAATTRISERALEVMNAQYRTSFGNAGSQHAVGQAAHAALLDARTRVARCFNADQAEVIFTSGGTEADNLAIFSAATLGRINGKCHIVSTAFEHHAVLNALEKLAATGFEVTLLTPSRDGVVHAEQVARALRPSTCLVSVMTANNEIGTLQPIAEIGQVCREAGVYFHTDAVAAAGQMPIDTRAMGIDMLSASAHKFHGPKGVGLLFARRGIKLTRMFEGGGQERGYRPGTENVPAIVATAVALEESLKNQNLGVAQWRDEIIDALLAVPGAYLTGDPKHRLAGNVHFTFDGVESETLLVMLDARGICVSAGAACTAGALTQSHVLKAVGVPEGRAALRITLDCFNQPNDAAEIVKNVKECLAILRK